ncbi:UNVERIFIED_CONTAM: protein DNA-DAMAGE INDUCIBLE 1 [Sesamum radiatum]|uniref:Protein DNA-DAMAGE INDUCIBLE 1 n=1 Tax=Sesamum radiatum TaxID=300843 RepID=A0AAW2KKE1_SESRA
MDNFVVNVQSLSSFKQGKNILSSFQAFVDSGAQSTLYLKVVPNVVGMLFALCSSRLLRLLDTRYKGIAHGVGQSEILGRIHVAPIKCIIDLKENVLRVGGGEVAVPFLAEKDIPTRFLDEERHAKEASSSGAQATSATKESSGTPGGPSGSTGKSTFQGPEFEAKVAKLVELGFGREQVIQALKFFDGNEEQAAGFLFGG